MKVSQAFIEDLRYLKAFYQWNAEDVKEVKAAIKDCEPMVRYFTILAAAHRAGYAQHAGNGFVRLGEWCRQNGLGDPYGSDFDPAALDAMKTAPRAA